MKTVLSINSFVLAVVLALAAMPLSVGAEEAETSFVTVATQLRKEWKDLQTHGQALSAPREAQMRRKLGQLAKGSTLASGIANYLLLRLAIVKNADRDNLLNLMDVQKIPKEMLPEGLFGIRRGRTGLEEPLATCNRIHGELLPLSMWGGIEAPQAEKPGEIVVTDMMEPPRPCVPRLDKRVMLNVAVELEKANAWDLAWRAYLEVAYYNTVESLTSRYTGTWLSEKISVYWLKVAECAYEARKTRIAASYLLKAAVFGGKGVQKTAEGLAVKWARGKRPEKSVRVANKKEKIAALTKAVYLYAKLNAHPRSLQLISKYPDLLEGTGKLRKQIEQQWTAVAKEASVGLPRRVVFYGVQVSPKGDPFKVKIPWAFSEEAIRSAKARLIKLKAKLSAKSGS